MGFLGGFFDFLATVGQQLYAMMQYLINVLVTVFQFVWTQLVAVFNFLWGIARSVGKFFGHLWNNFFKGIFSKVLKYLQKVHRWLEDKLGPVLKFLARVRRALDRYYRLYIKPVLNVLQKIRQVLLIMRLLHISFAKQLDAYILKIEQQITHAFLTIRGIFTSLINVVNAVVDAPLLLRKPVMVLSIRRTFHSMIRAFSGLPVSYFFPSSSPGAPRGVAPPPPGHSFMEPEFNPPAAFYLGGDPGLGAFDGYDPLTEPPDDSVNGIDMLPYFAEAQDINPACVDVADCLRQVTELCASTRFVSGTAN